MNKDLEKRKWRHERKFLVSELTKQEIESLIKLHPSLFREIYYPRYINNIYCDSLELRNYFDNIHGAADRVKVRIRWYGALSGLIEKPVLELKIKKGLLGTKDSHLLSSFVLDECFTSETLNSLLDNSGLTELLRLKLATLKPTLINRYLRRYYLSANGLYRITLDTEMKFYAVNTFKDSCIPRYTDHINSVVELKYDRENDLFAHKISNFFPFRMTKNSKYINGIEWLA